MVEVRRVGDMMIDLVSGEKKEIASVDPVVFTDGTAMKNPDCYEFVGNTTPFPVPTEVVIGDSSIVIDGKKVDTGHFRCTKLLHKYEGGLVLEAAAKDQEHKILIDYNEKNDRFTILTQHSADKLDVLYENGNIWAVRTTRTDKVEDIDEDDNPTTKFPVYEDVLVLKDGEVLETLSSDWMFGDLKISEKKDDDIILVFASIRQKNVFGEAEEVKNHTRITKVLIQEMHSDDPDDEEDENDEPYYEVNTYNTDFIGSKVRTIRLAPGNAVFVIGEKSILYSGDRTRWANGSDVVDAAIDHPHLIRCEVEGNTTTFMLANDQYETVRIRTEATADRGLVSVIEK